MKLQFFSRLQYESFICIALDTKKYRYWYSLSTPLYLKWFPQYLVDDRLRTKEEKDAERKLEKSIGIKSISIQPFLEFICHLIVHIKYCFEDIQRDKYWAEREPAKYGNYTKWYKKLFSKKFFNEHQCRCN